MADSHPHYRMTLAEAVAQLPVQAADKLRFVTLFKRGSLSVELYAPQGRDNQKPHTQDELYVILSGSGIFVNSGECSPFTPGDMLFVPAGVEHRFESFTADFQTWVIFYGPQGGEQVSLHAHATT